MSITARQIHLVSRPDGMPNHDHFATVEVELPAPGDGQVLIKNHYMSVDPYMRGRMRAQGVYAEPYALNQPMHGGAVGEVLKSNAEGFEVGDIVLNCLLYTSPSPRDLSTSRMPSSA